MTSLYLLYRPQIFSDLVGQEPVKRTLTQAVAKGRIGHAYLFSGPKGSGKTTTARILAKAVNCLRRKSGEAEPCNRCATCLAIDQGSNLDILEIDAASHRGIEEIKELREAVRFAPSTAKKKVYIIDEVHMLTREAFNALLKTLEEPPPHALFILATTEPHKIPATIKSRTQHFQFSRASIPELVSYLSRIAKKEKIQTDPDVLKLIAGTAEGSFRDSLSALEQVVAAYPPGRSGKKKISPDDVRALLGLADHRMVLDFLAALAAGDTKEGMHLVGKLGEKGQDVQAYLRHCLDALRAILRLKLAGKAAIEGSYTDEEVAEFEEIAAKLATADIVRLMEKLIEAGQLARIAPVPELPLEMVVAEVAGGDNQQSTINNDREAKSQELSAKSSPSTTAVPVAKEIEKVDDDIWQSILSEVKAVNTSLHALLKEAIVLGQTADGIALGVRFRFHAELLSAGKHQSILTEAVTKALGHPAQVIVEVKPEVFTKKEEELLKMAEELL